MDFVQFVTDKFTNFGITDLVELLSVILILMFVYCYAANHNGKFFSIVCIILSIFTFVITIFGYKHFAVGTLAVMMGMQFISFVVLFRNELRRDIFKLGLKGTGLASFHDRSAEVITHEEIDETISHTVKACQNMSKSEVGALIVIVKDSIYDYIIESGTKIDAEVSSEMLETIFFPKSPLHDGAVIIKGNRILAAGCSLPLSQDTTLPKEFGMRHRAAYGVTESHPTLTAIVVSEESGVVTAMYDKKFKRYLDSATLTKALKIGYNVAVESEKEAFWGGVEENAE